jgi:hypothetical protein
VSRQYQRRSGQALPPSATISSSGRRIPHIQQDLALAVGAQCGVGRSWSVTACSPGRVSARAAVAAWGAGTVTGRAGAPNRRRLRPIARLGSRSPDRSSVSDAPTSFCQSVVTCKPSRPLAGTWLAPCVCPPSRVPSPFRGTGSFVPDFLNLTALRLHYCRIDFR